MTASRSLFVYYRVAAERQAEALIAIKGIQAQLQRHWPGLQACLMQRADSQPSDPEATWMETYTQQPSGVSPECESELSRLAGALPSGLIGERHTEAFTPLASADSV